MISKYLPGPLAKTRVRLRTSNSPGFKSALINSMMRPVIRVARNISVFKNAITQFLFISYS